MKLLFCVICGTNKDLQHHHIVPLAAGGEDHQHNIITLCCDHHDWIHGIRRTRSMPFSELVKLGQQKAGNYGGRPGYPEHIVDEIIYLWKNGHSYRQIKSMVGCSLATAQKYIKEYKQTLNYA
jgi:hypothetical protein